MTPDLLEADAVEGYKGALHLAMFGLAAPLFLYNVGALLIRPSCRLVLNAALYGIVLAVEPRHIYRHWSAR